jgi:5-carboxymethyl-2-hydroxymuconate isomerase
MPHIIVEYTKNILHDVDKLLKKLTVDLSNCGPTYPISAIRARAIELRSFYMADGAEDYAFVHIELRVAPGRPPEAKLAARMALLEAAKAHFHDVFAARPLALTVELTEAAAKSDKHSNFLVNGLAP